MQVKCTSCGKNSSGNFCNHCGQSLTVKRITLKGILHEAFHLFTHFDKGFLYTLKRLFTAPGKMQREYVEGRRSIYQKPFSMFFICISLAALALYWINHSLPRFGGDNEQEAGFFHQYLVLVQVCLLPVYVFINYLFYKNSSYNYAEIGILQLYNFAFIFIVLVFIHLLKFIWPHFDTRYIELPIFTIYVVITNIYFFYKEKLWANIIKSILMLGLIYFVAAFCQDRLVEILVKH